MNQPSRRVRRVVQAGGGGRRFVEFVFRATKTRARRLEQMADQTRRFTRKRILNNTTEEAIFVQSFFPAPYRTAVFEHLSRAHQLFVAFEGTTDPEHNQSWFDADFPFDAVILRTEIGRRRYRTELKRLREYACVLVYEYASLDSLLLMARCLWAGVPYLINCDGAIPRPRHWRDHIKQFFITRAAACLAGSKSAVQYFLTYGADQSRIHRHPFTSLAAADIFAEPPSAEERGRLRAGLGLPNDSVIFASVGRFVPGKGFDILLHAWTGMPGEAHLLLIGGGPEESAYRTFVDAHDLGNVTIIPFQDHATLRKYYRAADAFVLATRKDIWGLVVNEAMACGLPVITTDRCVAGVELIVDERNGFIVLTESPAQLLAAMSSLLRQSPRERTEIGKRNLATITNYTYEAVATAHNELIATLVRQSWPRPRFGHGLCGFLRVRDLA
jgi:glycosyltransferase involved in cell wall biosynthesis